MHKLNSFQIKLFMITLMALDHIDKTGLVSSNLSLLFHVLSRCVGAWFGYLAVQGFIYTRSKLKYNMRLFFWGVVMLVGNKLLGILYLSKDIHIYNNIFLTLAFGVLAINILAYENPKYKLSMFIKTIIAIPIIFLGMTCEGGIPIIPLIIIVYTLRNNIKIRNTLLFALCAYMLISSFVIYDDINTTITMMLYNCDWLFISFLFFEQLYNGERGPNTKFSKYFFYVFYPAHIWLFTTIGYFIK